MFPASSSSKTTVVSAVLLMMMMMMMVPQAAAKPHRKFFEGLAEETVPLRLDPNNLVPSLKFSSLANDSISPWTYNISRDDTMFPHALSQAQCLLKTCLDHEGLEDGGLESRPIMHQALVLRRVKAPGAGAGHGYHYRLESKLISVGCTCVRPKVVNQH
ncbi:interleukin-17F-like [Nematolebias whitei]|uniref:interleukin-17F-like n=1 Tax=Nematolebias whitei TaxID=451745 RepID=UPI00189BA4D3|nr:interleukin-17F-like [Nematolebias whitei]